MMRKRKRMTGMKTAKATWAPSVLRSAEDTDEERGEGHTFITERSKVITIFV